MKNGFSESCDQTKPNTHSRFFVFLKYAPGFSVSKLDLHPTVHNINHYILQEQWRLSINSSAFLLRTSQLLSTKSIADFFSSAARRRLWRAEFCPSLRYSNFPPKKHALAQAHAHPELQFTPSRVF